MNLESQVCSLELAKKLKELGVKQESLFYWCDGETDCGHKTFISVGTDAKRSLDISRNVKGFAWEKGDVAFSAFTVAELGEILSNESISKYLLSAYGHAFNIPTTRFTTIRGVQLAMENPDIGAKMLIYLIENKLYSPKS